MKNTDKIIFEGYPKRMLVWDDPQNKIERIVLFKHLSSDSKFPFKAINDEGKSSCYKNAEDILSDEEKKKREILKIAKEKYPVGTTFIPAHLSTPAVTDYLFITEDSEFVIDEESICATVNGKRFFPSSESKYGNCVYDRVVYYIGKWAEVVNPLKKFDETKGWYVELTKDNFNIVKNWRGNEACRYDLGIYVGLNEKGHKDQWSKEAYACEKLKNNYRTISTERFYEIIKNSVIGVVKDEYYYCWDKTHEIIFKALETSNNLNNGIIATASTDNYCVGGDKFFTNSCLVYFSLDTSNPNSFRNYRKATKKEIELFESKNRVEFEKGEVYEAYNKEENLKYLFVAFETNNNAIASYCNVSDHRVARGGLFPFNFYTFKKATFEDLQTALYKYGKVWNSETEKLDIARIKYGIPYFYICDDGKIAQDTDDFLKVDDDRFKAKNYFHTKEAAEKYKTELLKFIDKFHEAN